MDRVEAIATGLLAATVLLVLAYAGFGFMFMSANDHGGPDGVALVAEPVPEDEVAADATATLTGREGAVAEAAIVNGSGLTAGSRLDIDGAYVERNGTYYRLTVAEAGRLTRQRPVVTFRSTPDYDGGTQTAGSLPQVDYGPVVEAYRRTSHGESDEAIRHVYGDPADANASTLVSGNVSHVRIDNAIFRVRVTQEAVELDGYRYTADQVADTDSAFVEQVVHDAAKTLSDSEREPLAAAVKRGPFTPTTATNDSRPWEAVEPIATLCGLEEDDVMGSLSGQRCYVRFEGQVYRLTLAGPY